jgi:hypothetical protein
MRHRNVFCHTTRRIPAHSIISMCLPHTIHRCAGHNARNQRRHTGHHFDVDALRAPRCTFSRPWCVLRCALAVSPRVMPTCRLVLPFSCLQLQLGVPVGRWRPSGHSARTTKVGDEETQSHINCTQPGP